MENDDIVQHLMRHEIPHDFRIIRNMVASLGLVEPTRVQHHPYSRVTSAVRLHQTPILKQQPSTQQVAADSEQHEISDAAATSANRLSPSPPMTSSSSSTATQNNNHHDNNNDVTDSSSPATNNSAAAPRSVSFKPQQSQQQRHGSTGSSHSPTGYNLVPFLALPCQLESHAVDDARSTQSHFQTLLAHIISDDAFLHSCFATGLNDDERQMYKLYEDSYKATEHAIQMAFVKTRWLQNPPTQTDDDNSLVLIGFQCSLPNDRSELIKGVHMRLLRQLGLAGKFPHSNCVSESADALVKAIGKNLKKAASGDHSGEKQKNASHNRLSSLLHSTSAKSLLEKYKHEGCVLFIAESEQVNECTPLVIELEMRGIETFMCSLKQFSTARTQLTVSVDGKLSYILPTMKDVTTKAVEMVVYADPFAGLRVDDPREWYDIRVIIEKSHAVTCPSARYLMASSTRILANLQKGNNMKQFLKSADLSASVMQKLVEMVPLDVEEIGENYVQRYYHPITTAGAGNVFAGQHSLRPTSGGTVNSAIPSPTIALEPSNATFIEKLDPIVESNVMVMPDTLRAGQVVPIVSMYGVMVTRKAHVVSSEVYDDVEVCGESAPCKFINLGLYECIEPRFVSSAVYNLHHATEKDTFGH